MTDDTEPKAIQGQAPSEEDTFFLEAQWRAVESSPEAVAAAGKEMMGVIAIVSGLYMTGLQIGGVAASLAGDLRFLALLPYLAWLPGFYCAWLAYRPKRRVLARNAPDATRQGCLDLARERDRWMKAAAWLLFSGIVIMVICGGWLSCIAGEVSQ